MRGEPLVEVRRGPLTESVHEIAACAVDARGEALLELGDVDAPVYLRSTAKPFIAAASVKAGVVERFGLEPRELAVMAASHYGEPFHVDAVRSILRKIGLPESALQCGAHPPYNAAAAAELEARGEPFTAVHNNCSGKHAGILALCLTMGCDPQTYLEASNPAEQTILEFCARMTGDDPHHWPVGIDGCGIPVFATPLRRAARAFMHFATLEGIDERDARALATVRDAMLKYPEYVSGTGEFDSVLMANAGGTIACKGGAEGVHGDAAIGRGVGLGLKVIDGARRAVAPAVLATLASLGALPEQTARALDAEAHPSVKNRAGRNVGEIAIRRAILEKARKK
ncbi:MAG: asparaginase [Candidatus Eremiobacteraeota bacterium]|nr:asparaginase [Candidatus Eremiobacteraeota bacterium]